MEEAETWVSRPRQLLLLLLSQSVGWIITGTGTGIEHTTLIREGKW